MSIFPTPLPISTDHNVANFDCGVSILDQWLKERAVKNERSGASRTFVATQSNRVIGYYCLAAGAIAMIDAPSRLRRNMPDPIPAVILGRLAIDQGFQGKGLGGGLLADAVERAKDPAIQIGIAGMLVHAIDEDAKRFYSQYAFVEAPGHPMAMVLTFWK